MIVKALTNLHLRLKFSCETLQLKYLAEKKVSLLFQRSCDTFVVEQSAEDGKFTKSVTAFIMWTKWGSCCEIQWPATGSLFHVGWRTLNMGERGETPGTDDRGWNTPLCPYPPLRARCPQAPLVFCYWRRARLIMCSLLQWKGEKESGRGTAGWLPRPAGSPGPDTALMRAEGADGHTQGAGDYCLGPRGARERDLRRGDEETPAGTLEADLCSCSW